MRTLVYSLTVASLPLTAAPLQAAEAAGVAAMPDKVEVGEKKAKTRRVCFKPQQTGTRIGARRVCRRVPVEEMAAEKAEQKPVVVVNQPAM